MDPFLIYLIAVNVVAFIVFTIDFFLFMKSGRELVNHAVMCLFAVLGGGVGMLASFLIWDRKVVKSNAAWRFAALMGIVVWTMVVLAVYGVITIDLSVITEPLGLEKLAPLGIYLLVINIITFIVFAYDKRQATRGGNRVREFVLLGLSFIGGALGGLIAMYVVRHKTSKWYFKYGLPAMIVLHIVVLIYLRLGGII